MKSGKLVLALALPAVLGAAAAHAAAPEARRIELKSVTVHFPKVTRRFTHTGTAKTSYCMICHSTGMITTQPPMLEAAWKAEVAKMKGVYGCPVPSDEVADQLVSYFYALNNKTK
jgi:cytochrome c5